MLVHLVEEGLAESDEADVLVRHYLRGRPPIDTLILGCTHYPMLSGAVKRAARCRECGWWMAGRDGGAGGGGDVQDAGRTGDVLRNGAIGRRSAHTAGMMGAEVVHAIELGTAA